MNSTTKQAFSIAGIAATIFLGIQALAIQFDTIFNTPYGNIIKVVLASGGATALFKLLIMIYNKWIWRWINKKYLLEGKWQHELKRSDDEGDFRTGTFEITQTIYDIKFIKGRNESGKKNHFSNWKSNAIFFDYETDELKVIYEISRTTNSSQHGESKNDYGIFLLRVYHDQKLKPIKLEGEYFDAGLSVRRGIFTASKIK